MIKSILEFIFVPVDRHQKKYYGKVYIDKDSNVKSFVCPYCGKVKPMSVRQRDHVISQNLFRKIDFWLAIPQRTIMLFLLMSVLVRINAMFNLIEGNLPSILTDFVIGIGAPTNTVLITIAALFQIVRKLLITFKDSKYNIVMACQKCNVAKSDKFDIRVLKGFIGSMYQTKFAYIVARFVRTTLIFLLTFVASVIGFYTFVLK